LPALALLVDVVDRESRDHSVIVLSEDADRRRTSKGWGFAREATRATEARSNLISVEQVKHQRIEMDIPKRETRHRSMLAAFAEDDEDGESRQPAATHTYNKNTNRIHAATTYNKARIAKAIYSRLFYNRHTLHAAWN
jgi:hypothetical protein